ncbi:MAG: hypothetical protein A2148_04060 [Chloroflexi bacterium RBG_16_68_14]|nr:MAG: hypothetical protein A2148_04060 [Chloroflexi bacterium RBG_16_68_14]
MQLIRSVQIERFRSLGDARLDGLADMVALVGPNNCGKSNVLRAMNLFFNDETDRGELLDFSRDYHLLRRSRPKEIRVAVEFSLPASFKFRKGLEAVEELLGRQFALRKTWTVAAPFDPTLEIAPAGENYVGIVQPEDAFKVRQFLDLIEFRYIPNRAVPVEEIRRESPGIVQALARRIANYRPQEAKQLFQSLETFARNIVQPIARDLEEKCQGIRDLELATPGGPFELLFSPGFRTSVGAGGKVEDSYLGAGVQSLLMFHILHLVDSYGFQNFGWRQAAVWGVEEPESSLHRDLQIHLALLFRSYTGPTDRFQILDTTHNEVFIYSAGGAYQLSATAEGTQVQRVPIAQAAEAAAQLRVTGSQPPLLKHLFDPLVLVEGSSDALILDRAAQLTGARSRLVFVTPSQLDPTCPDGLDGVKELLVRHAPDVSRRLPVCPLLVLLDWDVPDGTLNSIMQKYGPNASLVVKRMEESWADETVHKSFRGIERFFPPDVLREAANGGVLALAKGPGGRLQVAPDDLARAKGRLHEFFLDRANAQACRHIRPAIKWAELAVKQARAA